MMYEQSRALLKEENAYSFGAKLNEEEKKADDFLKILKDSYISSENGKVDYNFPFLTDKKIWESGLYAFFKRMPKGSDLHTHAFAQLPAAELVDFLAKRTDIEVCTKGENKHILYLSSNPEKPEGCMPMVHALSSGALSMNEILEKWTVLGTPRGQRVWDYFEWFFTKDAALTDSYDIIRDLTEETMRYYCRMNVLHVEQVTFFFGSHEDAAAKALAIREGYYAVKKDYPDFTLRIHMSGLKTKFVDPSVTKMLMDNGLYVYEHVKDDYNPEEVTDFVTAADLVNEEDLSRPLSFYKDMLFDIKRKAPALKLVLHAGESLLAENDNVLDAYLLGASRVGHGFNLYRYPSLLEKYKEAGIVLDICPVSNLVLKTVNDLRRHPGVEYLKRGLFVTINSDDGSYEEHTTLADDYFAVCLAWDLGLSEIKQLAKNSVLYAAVSEKEKAALFHAWQMQWGDFIKEVNKSRE